MLNYLLSNPIFIVPVIAAILIAFTVHEFSHALAAETLGDPTPKSLGRLTLNPISHIHGLGFLLLLVAGFGWGKPVPFDPRNLKNPKVGSAIIGFAGPFSNFILAIAGVGLIWLLGPTLGILPPNSLLTIFLVFLVQFNIILLVFNLIPIPPLDGSKVLFALIPDRYAHIQQTLTIYGPMILLALIIFDSLSPISIFGTLFGFFLNGIDRLLM